VITPELFVGVTETLAPVNGAVIPLPEEGEAVHEYT